MVAEPFESTHWSAVMRAAGSSTEARDALSRLCEAYWFPLYAYLRRRFPPDEAEELTQQSGSSWLLRCVSNTYDGTWELCEASATAGQTFKAELRLRSANATGTYIGIAWRNYNPSTDE